MSEKIKNKNNPSNQENMDWLISELDDFAASPDSFNEEGNRTSNTQAQRLGNIALNQLLESTEWRASGPVHDESLPFRKSLQDDDLPVIHDYDLGDKKFSEKLEDKPIIGTQVDSLKPSEKNKLEINDFIVDQQQAETKGNESGEWHAF